MSMMEDVVWEEENASPQRGSRAARSTPCRREVGGGGGADQLRRIRWDRFLPTRSLRVLLVEHDDSTRHIVAALLRKCSYHVAAVADGLKAWEVMKGKSYSFDLVLTEFEVPSLSGIGLLGKIVGTEDCKNIPVIMMSSQDSVGIVHKCMLKGAVDFLVKPLRKNELRNLWQHVWRRHCSNTYACTSENNAASNQISSNVGDWSHTGETSDKGSDSDQVLDQSLGGKLDKKVEIFRKQAEPVLAKDGQFHRETGTHLEQPQNNTNTIAISLVMDDNAVLRDKTLVIEYVAAQPIQMALLVENSGHVSHRDVKVGNEKPNLNHQINSQEEFVQSSDGLAKSLANGQCSHPIMKTAVIDENLSTDADRSRIKHGVNSSSLPLWELSLMTKLNGCVQNHVKQNTILKHSNASAFSRYGGTSSSSACKPNSSSICIKNKGYIDQTPQVSCRGTDNVEPSASRVEVFEKFQIFSDGNMEEDTARHSQLGFMPMPIPVGAVPYSSFCMGYGEPMHQDNALMVQSFSAAGNGQSRTYSDSHSGSIEFRCDDLNHPLPCRGQVNDTEAGEERGLSSSPTEEVYKNGCSSRDVLKCCGSNDSDDTMGDAAAATGAGRESGNENGIQNFVKNGMSSDLSHREAAIIKFRLKRKDRCFAKKVRYHSRQKLAEQRPRVKGQFVSKRS